MAAVPAYIDNYYRTLRSFEQQRARNEGATRVAFQNLLSEAGRSRRFEVLAEQTITLANRKRIRVDGEVRDEFRIRRGVWEAKDTADALDEEIRKKIEAGYPTKNTIFENTRRAVLFQNGRPTLDVNITQPRNLQHLLDEFLGYSEPQIDEFHQAVAAFRQEIPQLAAGLTGIIEGEKRGNKRFAAALEAFLRLCQSSLNPQTTMDEVEDMLKQHLLTERIFRSVFANPDFVRRNAIAQELEKVVAALTSRSFSRDQFMSQLDYFYRAIEEAARTIADYGEKQSFLHAVYEQFFQSYSTDTADTHGIVYTPAPIVKWMVASVEEALRREFGTSLGERGVHVLDPCVGTGTFMLELMERIPQSALPHKYAEELHCNEILLLPYYIAAQNIEHEYWERTGAYQPFEGICFADTLTLHAGPNQQLNLFAEENTERIQRQEEAPIFVVIGNPPYNVGQTNENDNNKNRPYPEGVDKRIRQTYVRSSRATLNMQLYDAYVRFFRWATDRLGEQDGIVCFVSNNSFLNQYAFDGVRRELRKDYTSIYVLDLGGNVRQNPKLSGTTHNVFGIQVGVGITLMVRNRRGELQEQPAKVYYARVDEWWRKEQKYAFLDDMGDMTRVEWRQLTPNIREAWLTEGLAEEFHNFTPMGSKEAKSGLIGATETLFRTYGLGVATNRDAHAYSFNADSASKKATTFIDIYNTAVDRYLRMGRTVDVSSLVDTSDNRIKWTRQVKTSLVKAQYSKYDERYIRNCAYRPFTRLSLYFDDFWNEEQYQQPLLFPTIASEHENRAICVTGIGSEKPFIALLTNTIVDYHLAGPGANTQCFPFYTYREDGSNRQENITDWALQTYQEAYGAEVTKWDIFYYVYGLLHSPEYRAKYAENLKRDLPHIPLMSPEAFAAFAEAGRRLAALHVGYERAAEYPLKHEENRAVPWTWRVERMRLSADRTSLRVNEALTLAGIPPEVYDYRLGNRSALEWVIDQYRVKTDARSGITSDPNDPDDPEAIVRLVKQVVTVSVETVRIVAGLPRTLGS